MAPMTPNAQDVLTVLQSLSMDSLIRIARQAGQTILDVQAKGNITIITKADDSPVTNADHASHALIERELTALKLGWPILSEEGVLPDYEERKDWSTFWLVDPLDGTQEFINGTDRFGINMALVHQGRPVFGLMHFPARNLTFYATQGQGAFVITENGIEERLEQQSSPDRQMPLTIIGTAKAAPKRLEPLMVHWNARFDGTEWMTLSGPLKFCWLAWGKVHAYPRFGPSAEWDTAPPEIILKEVGLDMVEYPSLQPIQYNKPRFPNKWFICGHSDLWQELRPVEARRLD